jgi:hypothetical protein
MQIDGIRARRRAARADSSFARLPTSTPSTPSVNRRRPMSRVGPMRAGSWCGPATMTATPGDRASVRNQASNADDAIPLAELRQSTDGAIAVAV